MYKPLLAVVGVALMAHAAAAACGSCALACDIKLHTEVTGVTTEQPLSNLKCTNMGGSVSRRGAWYKFVGTGQYVMASLCDEDTDFDTNIAVFSGSCAADCSHFDDDGCGVRRSTVTFPTIQGVPYLIFVTGFGNATGAYTLVLTPVEQPTNYECIAAENISTLPYASYDDTTIAPKTTRRCDSENGTEARGLWYRVLGHGHWVHARTCDEDTAMDTVIDVYTGGCLDDGGARTCLTFNDDACGIKSEVTWFAVPNTWYHIFVGGFGNAKGKFLFELHEMDPHENSYCTKPITVNMVPFVYDGNTANATTSISKCQGGVERRGQWFRYRGHGLYMDAFTCAFDNTKTTFDNAIDVYTQCFDDATTGECLTYNDDYCLRNSRVRFFARLNVEYWIYVSGYSTAVAGGPFTLTVEPSENDTNTACWKAHHITELPYDISTDTADIPMSMAGCVARKEQQGRWYSYYHNSMSAAEIMVDSCNDETTVKTSIEVYQACDSTVCKHTPNVCPDGKAFVTFMAQPYVTYYIIVYGETPGFIHLDFSLHEPVPHATCKDALVVSGVPFQTPGITTDAAVQYSNCTGRYEHGQWFWVKGTGNKMAASTCSLITDFDTAISVFAACRIDNYKCLAFNDDAYDCGHRSKVTWQSFKGANYYIYVHGVSTSHGVFQLQIHDESSPPEAKCGAAIEIPSLPYTDQGITTYSEPSNGTCHEFIQTKGIWYKFSGQGYRTRISTCFEETEFDTMIDVYEGCIDEVGHHCVTESDNTDCGRKGDVTFNAYKGTTYYFVVTSNLDSLESSGFYEVSVMQLSPIFPDEPDKKDDGLSGGAIAGIVIAVLAVVGGAGAAGFFFWKKRTLRADYNVIS